MKLIPVLLLAIAIIAVVLYSRRRNGGEDLFSPDGLEGAPVNDVLEEAGAR
jgi:hypothetical protein